MRFTTLEPRLEDVDQVLGTLELAREPLTTLAVCRDSGFETDTVADGGIGRTLYALDEAARLGRVRHVAAGVGELWAIA